MPSANHPPAKVLDGHPQGTSDGDRADFEDVRDIASEQFSSVIAARPSLQWKRSSARAARLEPASPSRSANMLMHRWSAMPQRSKGNHD